MIIKLCYRRKCNFSHAHVMHRHYKEAYNCVVSHHYYTNVYLNTNTSQPNNHDAANSLHAQLSLAAKQIWSCIQITWCTAINMYDDRRTKEMKSPCLFSFCVSHFVPKHDLQVPHYIQYILLHMLRFHFILFHVHTISGEACLIRGNWEQSNLHVKLVHGVG